MNFDNTASVHMLVVIPVIAAADVAVLHMCSVLLKHSGVNTA